MTKTSNRSSGSQVRRSKRCKPGRYCAQVDSAPADTRYEAADPHEAQVLHRPQTGQILRTGWSRCAGADTSPVTGFKSYAWCWGCGSTGAAAGATSAGVGGAATGTCTGAGWATGAC